MSDELDQQGTEETQEPSLQEQIRQIISSEFDNRFKGLQSASDKRLASIAQTVEQLKTAQLPPEEQEQLEANEKERLRRENALLRLGKQYPEEVELLEQFFGADNLEDQVEVLSKFRKVTAQESTSTEDETPEPTPVASNNQRRQPKVGLAEALQSGQMSEELADEILNAADEPGMLVKIRKLLG